MPIIVKYTKLPKDVVEKSLDFMVEKCIWDANHGLADQEGRTPTAALMERVGNIPKGQMPKYEELVDLSFANEAIKELGEYKGPLCPSEPDAEQAALRSGLRPWFETPPSPPARWLLTMRPLRAARPPQVQTSS